MQPVCVCHDAYQPKAEREIERHIRLETDLDTALLWFYQRRRLSEFHQNETIHISRMLPQRTAGGGAAPKNFMEEEEVNRDMAQTILLVEDEESLADLIEIYLNSDGYAVHKCHNAKDALEYLKTEEPALAVLDIMLPDMDGYQICRKIRERYFFPIIMLTAKTADTDKIRGLAMGADDYITKPFNTMELLMRIKTQLRRSTQYNRQIPGQKAGDGQEKLDIHGLVINREEHSCSLYGEELALTPTEFEILWYLCKRRGRVVSSEELFVTVWGEKSADCNSTIIAHIGRIREKMKESAKHPNFIKTVWGVGYKIE